MPSEGFHVITVRKKSYQKLAEAVKKKNKGKEGYELTTLSKEADQAILEHVDRIEFQLEAERKTARESS